MKSNIEYYRHFTDSHTHAKFKMLRLKYGWAGEGKFWALNNMIASSTECWLDLNKKYNKAAVASDLEFTMEELDEYVQYLVEDCELLLLEDGKISTNEVQENYSKVADEREKARERKARKSSSANQNKSSANHQNGSANQLRGTTEKNKKVKESKVKEISSSGSAEKTEKGILLKELKNEIPPSSAPPPLTKQFEEQLRNDVNFIATTCKNYQLKEREFWERFSRFKSQKNALEELTHKKYSDFRKNFYFWLGKNKIYAQSKGSKSKTSSKNWSSEKFAAENAKGTGKREWG